MSEDQDEQAAQIRGKNRGETRTYSRGDSARGFWIPPSVLNTLIVAAILGLSATLWNLRESISNVNGSVNTLSATIEMQQRQIDRIERRQDTFEGRNLRGGEHAPDQQ